MSKNLRGYSGTQIQINLDEINASSVTATNGNFTNLTIGTYSITTLNVSDLVASGVVKFTGLTNNESNDDLPILVKSETDDRIYQVLDFTINPQTGLITAGTLKLLGTSTLPVGSTSASYKMLFLHSTGNVYRTEGLEWNEVDDVLTTPKLHLSNIVNPLTNTNYPILIIDGDEIKKISVTDVLYNKSNQSLTAYNIISSNEIYYKSQTLDQRFEPLGGGVGGYVTLTTAQTISGAKTFSSLLTASGDLDVGGNTEITGNLNVDGVSTFNQEISIVINQDNTDDNNRQLLFQGVNNVIHGDTSLLFNPSSNLLSVPRITLSNILIGQDATFNGNLTVGTNGQIDGTFEVDGIATFNNDTTINKLFITTLNSTSATSCSIPLRISTGEIKQKSTFNYNASTDTLNATNSNFSGNTQITGNLNVDGVSTFNQEISIVTNQDNTDNNDRQLLFRGVNNVIHTDTSLLFNPYSNLLIGEYATFNGDLTVGMNAQIDGILNVDSASSLSGNLETSSLSVSINSMAPMITNTNYAIMGYDYANIGKTLNVDTANFYYNKTTETLHAPNLTVAGTTNITAFNATANLNNRILFLSDNTATGDISYNGNLYFNPFNETLRSPNITVDENITLLGTNNATLEVDASTNNYGLIMTSNDGFVMREGPNWKLRVDGNLVTVYNNLQVNTSATIDGDITKNTATLSAVARDLNVLFHDNDAGDKRIKEHNLFHFNPSDELLSVPNLTVSDSIKISPSVPTASSQFPVLLLNEGTNEVKKADTFLSYDPTLDRIYAKDIMINDAGTSGRLTLVEPIRYGGSLFYTNLNAIYAIGNTDTIVTIDVLGSGLNTGKFGGGLYIGINRSGVKAKVFASASVDLWTWNQYISATDTATTFTCNSLINGTWEITVMCDYTSSSSSGSNRVNPILRLSKNGTEIEEGTQSLYIRHQLGRRGTMRTNYILQMNFGDTIDLRTYLNYAGTTNYSSVIDSGQFSLSNFNFRAKFLGPLEEYDRTPT